MDEKSGAKRVRQVINLHETEKNWHGVWLETRFTPRGSEIRDLKHFEMVAKRRIAEIIRERIKKHGAQKIVGYVELGMNNAAGISRLHGFNSGSKRKDTGKHVLKAEDIDNAVDELFATINARIEEYEGRGSGWQLDIVNYFTLKCTNYTPILARGWIDLPEWVRAKKSVINIKNEDDRCFLFALTLAVNKDIITKHRDRPKNYIPYLDKLNMAESNFPIGLDRIPIIENANDLGINVWGLDIENAKGPSDIHLVYKATKDTPIFNLLRVSRGDQSHYCYISNLDGLMKDGITSTCNNICSICLQNFSDAKVLDEHKSKGKCIDSSSEAIIVMPSKENAFVRFSEIEKQLRVPFGIYLAMETQEIDGIHQATVLCAKAVSDYPDKFGETFREWIGDTCISDFLMWLEKRESYALSLLKTDVGMKLSSEEEAAFKAATNCYICEKDLPLSPNRHRDHNHITGKYRGAACAGCNINLHHKRFVLPIFVHGLKEKEAHLLIQKMDQNNREIRCLPQTVEKMLSFTWGRCKFLDTRAFIDADLTELVKSLRAADPLAFTKADIQILASPTKASVLNLMCVFESFRSQALRDISIDPAHFVGAPGLAWTAALRKTKARIECFSEGQEEMLDFVQKAIRGGVSIIRKRFARANNEYVLGYDSSKPKSWLQYLDCNSLYPSAMMGKLPISDYKWLSLENWEDEAHFVECGIWQWNPDGEIGYFVEVDVTYPTELHDKHNDFPLLPEQREFEPSPYMKNIRECFGLSSNTTPKLIPNLCKKDSMICHVAEIQQAMQQGLRVTKLRRVLEFRQEAFLKPWVEYCVEKRRTAQNEFEQSFWKLMMNSVFGKTCEQVQNRVDIKFVKSTNASRLEHFTMRPQFKDAHIITSDLLAVELSKCKVLYNKPIAVGAAILGISKAKLADFWYGCIKTKYPEAQLCMTDTDSLIFHVETSNIYKDMADDKKWYDTSNYNKNHPLYSLENAKIPGFFKDETKGRPIAEFVGLRAKMYSLEMADGGKTKQVAGGIQLKEAEKLKHDQFREALFASSLHKLTFQHLKSKDHVLSTETVERIGLCPYDDKSWVCDDGITSYAHGHYKTI